MASSQNRSAANSQYEALIVSLADRRPYGYQHSGQVVLDADYLHTVLASHADLAEEALSSPHFTADIVDALNDVHGVDSEDSRLALIVRQYLTAAASQQVFEDVRELLWQREDAESMAVAT